MASRSGRNDAWPRGDHRVAHAAFEGGEFPLAERPSGAAVSAMTVEQRDGSVYVNGHQLNEPYVHKTNDVTDKTPAFRFSSQCIKVPDGEVFVLGDNRMDSNASNMFGPIPEDSIVGRAFVRVWPIGDIGGI